MKTTLSYDAFRYSPEPTLKVTTYFEVYDKLFNSEECDYYINLLEHYISNGLITKEEYDKKRLSLLDQI